MTVRLYATDSYVRAMDASVVDVDDTDRRILLDRTVFYPGGGGQPHDLGSLWVGDDRLEVERVTQDGRGVWHWVAGSLPTPGMPIRGELDWERRFALMRTHTAMHALCGVVWDRYASPVTGGNMQPGEGRLDFDLPDWNPDDKAVIEEALNREIGRSLPVQIGFLPRSEADRDPSLIRTKANLLPPSITEVRIIDIVGLDRQADGGTHVNSTTEVGRVEVAKVESKGKGFRRIRLRIVD